MAGDSSDSSRLPVRKGETAAAGWSGDEHRLGAEAAAEAGLDRSDTEVDSFTRGFSSGIVIDDPYDGAIVARGRTVLGSDELGKALRPAMQYLGVSKTDYKVKVERGDFEVRVAKRAADGSSPVLEAGKIALQIWVGFGLLGFAAYQFLPSFVSAIAWGAGLLLGAWQLRRGLASGRAMLGAQLAIALGMLAHEEQLILPPARDGA